MKKILIVDDNQEAADGLVRLLKALGWDAFALYSGKELLSTVSTLDADMAFIDIGMPDMSGYEVVAELRINGMYFPVVALTGYGQEEDIDKALAAGFTAHLTKPAGSKELTDMIAKFI